MQPVNGRVFLHEPGIVCALGAGVARVRENLFAQDAPRGIAESDALRMGKPLALGFVDAPLPALDDVDAQLRSRNNALLRLAYAQIETQVQAAIERFGAARVAIVLGTSTSGIGEAEPAFRKADAGAGEDFVVAPGFHYAQQEMGAPSRFLALESGARGPAWTVSTACSSSAKALASAARLLNAGIADAVIAGGADSLCRFTVGGFSSLEAVSATRCNPFSRNRGGINIGEGAALFLVTRDEAPVRLSGWGETSDAHHMSAPDPSGQGAARAMREALQRARLDARDVDYLNLHGTATRHNDAMESLAVREVFARDVPCSSTKPLTGHALGAAGAVEAALCWMSLHGNAHDRLPPHWWDGEHDVELPRLDFVAPGRRAAKPLRHALSTSYAFGGSNAALLFSRE